LKAAITALKAEVTKLSAAMPRGEQTPVQQNFQEESQKELSEKEKYFASFQKNIMK